MTKCNNNCLAEILEYFELSGQAIPYGSGHINDTYLLTSPNGEKYIIQRINNDVFKKPEEVMENIVAVTEHIRKKIVAQGTDPARQVLHYLKTKDNKYYHKTADGRYYRAYVYVDGVTTYDIVEKPEDFYKAAKAFGKFQKQLSDFPAHKLFETIPNFHNTRSRYEDFKRAIKEDRCGRLKDVQAEVDFYLAREADADIVINAMAKGDIPVRVTHNDTKLNNVLIDNETNEGICVIDLDTVMPGSLLYDFGDSMRFGTNTAAEDEKDLSKVTSDLNLFEHYTKGFLEELGDSITPAETELLPFSAKLMTLECGTRFLADHLNGDTYFKIHREGHNLDRARTQMKLVADMESKMDQMAKIVKKYI